MHRLCFFRNPVTQRLAHKLKRGLAEEGRAGIVDSSNGAVDVARVNDVRCLFDDVSEAAFDSMSFDKPRNFHQQLFMTERYLEVIVRACGEPLEQGRVFFSNCADEQNRNRRLTRLALQPSAELEA